MTLRPLLLVPLLVGAASRAQLPSDLTAWGPWSALAGADQSYEAAIERTKRWMRLSRSASLNRKLDPDVTRIVDKFKENIGAMDTHEAYAILGRHGTTDDDSRSLNLFGRLDEDGEYKIKKAADERPARFGDASVKMFMRRLANQTRYVVGSETELRLGDLTFSQFLGFRKGAMVWLSQMATTNRPTKRKGMDQSDQRCIDALSRSFPQTTALVLKYVDVEDVIAPLSRGARGRLRVKLNLETLGEDYPATAEQFESLRGIADVRARMKDGDGNTMAIVKFDSDTLGFSADFLIDPSIPQTGNFSMEADAKLHVAGLDISISNIKVDTQVREKGEIATAFNEVPGVEVKGALAWFVDAIIPSDIEGIITDFLTTMAKGNDGRGAVTLLRLPTETNRNIYSSSEAEIYENGFLAFWLSVGRTQFKVESPAKKEMRALTIKSYEAFDEDLDRFALRVVAKSEPGADVDASSTARP